MKISATILAAGRSSRMEDDNKLLMPLQGSPMISHVCNTVLSAGLSPVIVVTGYENEKVSQAIPDGVDDVVYNPNWESGMASSIYTAMSALPKSIDGNVIVLGDMPMITEITLKILMQEFIRQQGDRIIYPLFNGRQANPVIFPEKYFAKILASTGDRGCKKILKQYPGDAVGIPIESEEVVLDCDTRDDYFLLASKIQDHVQA